MRIFQRGNVVFFTGISFLDNAGDPADLASASLKVAYPPEGWPLDGSDYASEDIELTEGDDNTWLGEWDSRASHPGVIYWHAYTEEGDAIAQDGNFRLRANPANLEVEAP